MSVTAASRALNDRGDVAADKRQRVLDVARALEYAPNSAARTLVWGNSRTLGVIVNDNASPVYAGVLRGVERVAVEAGYTLLFANSANSQDLALGSLRTLAAHAVDGILMTPVQTDRRDLDELRRLDMPFVLLLRRFEDEACDHVVLDNRAAGRLATAHLLGHGRRRLGMVTGPAHVSTAAGRLQGFRDAHAECDLVPDPALVVETDFTVEGGHAAGRRLLDGPRDLRPDAVVAATDLQAVGIIQAATEMGCQVPEDVAVVGGDDIPLARFLQVPLTTFDMRAEEIGEIGARTLIARLAGDAGPTRAVVLAPRLVRRRSCGCPPDSPSDAQP